MKFIFYYFILFVVISCKSDSKKGNYSEIAHTTSTYIDGYVGDAECITCHKTEYNLWQGSHHDLAMQVANETTVLGDFNNVEIIIDEVDYHFYKKGNDFFVSIKEKNNSENDYKISYTFGVTPLQQYLVDFDKGLKQVLRVSWDAINNKWYHQYKGDQIEIDDWLHWTRGVQNWNSMCAECHSTNLKKIFN